MEKLKKAAKTALSVLVRSVPVTAELYILSLAHKTAAVEKDAAIIYILNLLTVAATVAVVCLGKKVRESARSIGWGMLAIAPAASFLLFESMIRDPFEIKPQIIFLNMAILYLFSFFVFFASGRTAPAVFAIALYGFVAGLGEHFVLIFRDAPIFPWDLQSLFTTGMFVAEYYVYDFTY